MKMFAFLMAIMVLVLSCMPCADAKPMSKRVQTEVKATTQDKGHEDACSPFCQCACCAGYSINHKLTGWSSLAVFASTPALPQLSADIFEIALPIWQPPQLHS